MSVVLAAACARPSERIEALKNAGDVQGLVRFYTDLKKDGRGTEARRVLDAIGTIEGKEAEDALLGFRRHGDRVEQSAAQDLLVARRSRAILPDLVAALLNRLQTGGDGREEAARIASIDPAGVRNAYDGEISAAEAARKSGSVAAAEQHLENAKALQKLAGGADLSGEFEKTKAVKDAARLRGLCEALMDALENGRLSESLAAARSVAAATGDEALARIVPDIEKLSNLEDRFYSVAQAQEKAKKEHDDAVRDGAPPGERSSKLAAYNAQKSAMVLARRALERERRKLPLITERVRQAVERFRR
jgi:hypothetical protein